MRQRKLEPQNFQHEPCAKVRRASGSPVLCPVKEGSLAIGWLAEAADSFLFSAAFSAAEVDGGGNAADSSGDGDNFVDNAT
jgi:hypothetical protein